MFESHIITVCVVYLVMGALMWAQVAQENHIEKKIRQQNKYAPIRFWKTTLFWLTHMFFRFPSTDWMCK